MADVNGVEPNQRRKEPDVSLRESIAAQVAVLGKDGVGLTERGKILSM